MGKYVTCTCAFELDAFHPVAPPLLPPAYTRTLSVSFGFASDDTADGAAKKNFADFLDVLRAVRFVPYRFTLASNGTITLTPAPDITVDMSEWAAPTGLSGIMPWLDERSGGKWITKQPKGNEEIDYRAVAASHLLHAAAGWDAPLPQVVGLSRLVRLRWTGAVDPETLILVPWFDASSPGAITATLVHTSDRKHVDVELRNVDSGGLTEVVISTHSLIVPVDPGTLVDEGSGYLQVLPRANEIADALRRVREHAPSLLWTLPQLLALQSLEGWESDPVDAQTHEPVPSLDDLRRAVWVGMSGLATLFDPLLLALTMGGTTREGPFLAALIAVIEELNHRVTPPPFGDFDSKTFAADFTKRILEGAGPTASPDIRAAILAAAFDLHVPDQGALDAETDLMPVVLGIYAHLTPSTITDATFGRKGARKRYGNSFDRQILVELGRLAKFAQEEDAVEAAALRVLNRVGIDVPWLQHMLNAAPEWCKQALDEFQAVLATSFNGLDATRFAQGSLFEAALVTEAKTLAPHWSDADLETALRRSSWFASRLGLRAFPPSGASGPITLASIAAAALSTIDLEYLDAAHRALLYAEPPTPLQPPTGVLDGAFKAVVAELFPRGASTRFVPDASPRNLPVQIAVDTDTADGDSFQSRFNGVALLVRRKGETWRYANYATLSLEDGEIVDNPVIHPLQPVAVDEQRRLFVEYAGVPLASRAFETTFAADAVDAADARSDHYKPFYDIDDAVLPPDSMQRLPALAYGSTYEIAAHVVSKAGVLPVKLQRSTQKPWLPSDDPDVPATTPPVVIVGEQTHLRTTAVGRVTLIETANAKRQRIGAAIEGVTPLATDYPRLTLAAPDTVTTMLDVLRNADGTGAITLPCENDEPFDFTIADLWWWGAAGQLQIDILNSPDALPDDPSAATRMFPASAPFAGGSIAVRIQSVGTDREFFLGVSTTPDEPAQVTSVFKVPIHHTDPGLGGDSPAWLRLRLTGTGATVTFADPTRELRTAHSASRPRTESLVLIAPTDPPPDRPRDPEWRPDLQDEVTAFVRFPQVGFVDFDRWFSNPACRALAFPKLDGETDDRPAKARADAFHAAVMTAYLGRMIDPGLAALVDAMPDLAASGLRFELCVVDGLIDAPSRLVRNALPPRSKSVPIDPLGKRPELDAPGIHDKLRLLASSWGANVRITCRGTDLQNDLTLEAVQIRHELGEPGWRVDVNVPRGVVARLSVRAVVPEAFFGEGADALTVFDARVCQLAVGHENGAYLFDGPSLTIEGMSGELSAMPHDEDGWIALARKSIVPAPAGKARVYSLIVQDRQRRKHSEDDAWNWRKLSSIDVQTQRWRFTGRPIYSWFDPKRGSISSNAAIEVAPDTERLDEFEAQAFLDRDEQDADIQTAQLEPGPAETVLQTFPWDLPSATMFRHRVTLRSRYAGALAVGRTSTQEGYRTSRSSSIQRTREDWYRVVMLADRARIQLTRPQLRALIPLTSSPTSDDGDAATPPVMAVLQEPPFVHGGLADRISAEIRTGFGFGFEQSPAPKPVHIVDARKEIGPDPRLTYKPICEKRARMLTLESEGPIGLTFDSPAVPAPTFANTALLLRPRLAHATNVPSGDLEEHFISVALRRYLDHRWLLDDDRAVRGVIPIANPCWMELDEAFTLSAGELVVLDATCAAGVWTARVNPIAVDPKGPSPLPLKELAIADSSFTRQLALLHLPLEQGRASLTLFAVPLPKLAASRRAAGDVATAGNSDIPHVLASFEWHVPVGVTELALSTVPTVRPTSASPVTHMNWTRTGKSFDVLHAYDPTQLDPRPVPVDALRGSYDSAAHSLQMVRRGTRTPLHLQSRMERNPLFVHRHLAVVTTVEAGGIGRPVEVYDGAKRLIGTTLSDFKRTPAAVRVVTFETPARPVGLNTHLPGMQSAIFDLFAVIGDKYDDDRTRMPKGLTFTYRPLGDTCGRSALTSLGFDIAWAGTHSPVTITIDPAHQNTAPAAVHVSIIGNDISWIVVFPDGGTLPPGHVQSVFTLDLTIANVRERESIEIRPQTFNNVGGAITGEYWGDISMLTVPPNGDATSFDWNWLFTGRDLAASDAVRATRLVTMAEAEARIVAVSCPISVLDPI